MANSGDAYYVHAFVGPGIWDHMGFTAFDEVDHMYTSNIDAPVHRRFVEGIGFDGRVVVNGLMNRL